jgi:hypothetical protein
MRKDQLERLCDLSERIAEVFIEEADPETWNGAGQPLSTLSQDQRGDRLWDKKNAIQTGALLARVLDLREREPNRRPLSSRETDVELKRYEQQAREMLDAVVARATSKG